MFDKYASTFVVALVAGLALDMFRDSGAKDSAGKVANAPWKVTIPFLNMQAPTIAGGAGGIF